MTLENHLEEHQESFNELPNTLTVDTGYGNEENYTLLENNDITAFIKYNYFHKEQRDKKSKDTPFLSKKLVL